MSQGVSQTDFDLLGNPTLHDLITALASDTLRLYCQGGNHNIHLLRLYESLTQVYQTIVLSEAEKRRMDSEVS